MYISKLRKRYKMSMPEMATAIRDNLQELGDHARCSSGTWVVDEDGIAILDEILKYNTYIPRHKEKNSLFDNEVETESSEDADLQHELTEARAEIARYQAELDSLQEKFILIQDGRESMNSSLIRKHQQRAEAAERELKKQSERFRMDVRLRDERISSLESRVADMQVKLLANHEELEKKQNELAQASETIESIKKEASDRCSQAEMKIINARRNEDKLYSNLHDNEVRLADLNRQMELANSERIDALRQVADMSDEMQDVKSHLLALAANIGAYLAEDRSDVSEIEGNIIEGKRKTPHGAQAQQKKQTMPVKAHPSQQPPASTDAIMAERDNLLEQMRQEQEAARREEEKGFLHSLFSHFSGKAAL